MTDQINEQANVNPNETRGLSHEDAVTDTGASDGGTEQSPDVDANVNDGNPIQPEPQDEQG